MEWNKRPREMEASLLGGLCSPTLRKKAKESWEVRVLVRVASLLWCACVWEMENLGARCQKRLIRMLKSYLMATSLNEPPLSDLNYLKQTKNWTLQVKLTSFQLGQRCLASKPSDKIVVYDFESAGQKLNLIFTFSSIVYKPLTELFCRRCAEYLSLDIIHLSHNF